MPENNEDVMSETVDFVTETNQHLSDLSFYQPMRWVGSFGNPRRKGTENSQISTNQTETFNRVIRY